MERSDFVARLRRNIANRRNVLMESYNKGLDQRLYDKTIGRIAELDGMNLIITEILKHHEADHD